MILEILIFILTTICFYYIYTYKKLHWYFEQRGLKFLHGVPVFGNLFGMTMGKKHFVEELDAVYNAFPDEKYVGFFEMMSPVVLIRDPEINKQITVKDFDHFVDRRVFFSEHLDPLLGTSLLAMKGDRWRDMRATLSPAFTGSKMKYMMPFMLDITKNILEYVDEHQNQDVDVDDLMRRYTLDVIASAGYGLQVNSVKDKDNTFFKIGNGIFDFDFKQTMYLTLDSQFPDLVKKLGLKLFSQDKYDFFTNIVSSTIEYRKKENVVRPDMIQLLMDTQQEWTAADLTSQVFVFFAAGFETSASMLVLSVHELALNEKVQDKLYQECKKFSDEKEFTFDTMSELKYLDCVVNETMRRWSTAMFLDRTCTKAYKLPPLKEGGEPYLLNPGDIVYNLVNQLHMDPQYFPEPHKYNPDRFSDENKHNIQSSTFIPFGNGPRICIGMRFAIMEIKVLLYHLVLNYKFVKTAKTDEVIKIKPHTFSFKTIRGTHVAFEKRL